MSRRAQGTSRSRPGSNTWLQLPPVGILSVSWWPEQWLPQWTRMQFFRHHRFWLAVTLALIMGVTVGRVSAGASACGDLTGEASVSRAVPEAPAAEFCPAMGKAGPCCCGPNAGVPDSHLAGCELSPPDCGCTVQVPVATPVADLIAVKLIATFGAALPPSTVVFNLPAHGPWVFPAPTGGPPRSAFTASAPARAPPTC